MKNLTRSRVQAPNRKRPSGRRGLRFESLEFRRLLAAQIAGGLYHDLNADGVHDAGESGLSDWTVFLDTNKNGGLDTGEPSQRTDADGLYHFAGLAAGDYRVTEVPRVGWMATKPTTGYVDVAVADSGEAIVNFLNKGTAGTGAITGLVWRDVNNNKLRDATDTPLASWTMFLDLNGNKILDPNEPTAITDGAGIYRFTQVVGGKPGNGRDYEVTEVIPAGWEPADVNITAKVLEDATTVMPDFSNWPDPEKTTSVSGRVFNDPNNNGIQDTGEVGLGGWVVYADVNLNGVLDTGEPADTTDTSGNYAIGGLEAGGVRIVEIPTMSFTPTSPATGYRSITTTAGVPLSNVNFGNRQRTDAAFGGVIFVDRDHDGIRDPGEEGLGGIRVFVDANDNGVYDAGELETETEYDLFYTPDVDEAGRYRFDHLPGGTYIVRQELPPELSGTPDSQLRKVIDLGPADDRSDLHGADRYRASEIHGVKFEDVNGNGIRDTGEPGVPGVTIFIDLNRDNVFDDGIEPSTLTGTDGSYEFLDLDVGAYIIREVVPAGWVQTFPQTGSPDGILWPGGVSNLPVGQVSPKLIQISLAKGETQTSTVSLTLPTTGALTNMVDVFLLFDDTGSFTSNSPIVRAAFPSIISQLQSRLTGIDLGFGVGRLEEYGGFASEYANGRPFILNQPIVAADVTGFEASIQAALDRVAPGYGGDTPETVIEALYQMVTGAGFDGNNDGDTLDSGAAGLASTQINPGSSGDVPAFSSFTADATNGVLAPSGTIGGAGFRSGALPIIITATDTGFAYQPKGDPTVDIIGIDSTTLPVSAFTDSSRGTTPFSSGAGIQETVTGLNALGALVIGLGTADSASAAPRSGLEALARMTGAINQTATSIPNGTPDPIDNGDPFYFKIGSGGDPLVGNIADGIVAAIDGAVTSVNVNVTLRASDPRVHISFTPGVILGLGAGDTATFDVTFTGDGRPTRFDLQFIRAGTDVVLGSIPVVLGTPVAGEDYEYEDCKDGEHSQGLDFGNQRLDDIKPNVAPSFVVGTDPTVAEDSGAHTAMAWATGISPGSASEVSQLVDFVVSNDNNSLFAVQPAISADGTLTFTPAANAFGSSVVTVELHDNGGTALGGIDTSAPQTFTIDVTAVNDATNAKDDLYSVNEDEVLTIASASKGVLSNDADIDSPASALRTFVAANPAHGNLTLNEDGTFSYTPALNFNGNDAFTYYVNDGVDNSNTATIEITVRPVNDIPTGAAAIVGSAVEDQELTVDVSSIADADGLGEFSYAWSTGATTASITLGDADVGKNITVTTSFTDGHGTTETLTSTAVGPVANVNDAPVGLPVIAGTAQKGQTLTANTSEISDADGLGTLVYQWLRNGVTMAGATTDTYLLTASDVGGRISVIVSYTDGHGTSEGPLNSSQTSAVTDMATGGETKFFVVDPTQRLTFKYDASGSTLADDSLHKENKKARGIAASPDGSTLWVADADGKMFIYDNDGHKLGSWEFEAVDKAEGVTVYGHDLWIVDRGEDRVFFFQDGALRRSGSAEPTDSFRLANANKEPMDLVTDGTHIWVVNSTTAVDKVFRYSTNGQLEGSWTIDPANTSPTGITIDPDDVNHIWIVDNISDSVYQYDSGTLRISGHQTATGAFALDPANNNPQGIADPRPAGRVTNRSTDEELPRATASSLATQQLAFPTSIPSTLRDLRHDTEDLTRELPRVNSVGSLGVKLLTATEAPSAIGPRPSDNNYWATENDQALAELDFGEELLSTLVGELANSLNRNS